MNHQSIDKSPKRIGWRKPVALFVGLALVMIAAKLYGIDQKLSGLTEWIKSLGILGLVVYVVLYVAGVIAALPGLALTLAAGPLFGSVLGVAAVSAASTIGAGLAFLIGRYIAKDAVSQRFEKEETFQRLNRLTEQHGAIVVALARLVPLFPFNLLNYGFGLTKIAFTTYLFWSWLCMLPGTILYVVGADVLWQGLTEGKISWATSGFVLGGGFGLFFITLYARKKMQDKEDGKLQ
jgi:uncharacterized membrane protein YdjX (TVP38/TMEM64 family)